MNNIFTEKNNTKTSKKLIGLIHKIFLIQLKTHRKYLASTKTKKEVRGGGRKPWKQKGTGNARAGSIRSSIWVGGGISFGPKPRVVYKKNNKKERRLALISALYLKSSDFIYIPDDFIDSYKIPKTGLLLKNIKNYLQNLKKKNLIIVPFLNSELKLAVRNCKNLKVTSYKTLNLRHLLNSDKILISKNTLTLVYDFYKQKKF